MHHFNSYQKATGITSFFIFCIYLFHPILSPYVKGLGLNEFQIGLMFALFPLIFIFISPILGSVSDHLGRRKVIIAGFFIQLVVVILYILASHWILILIARGLEAVSFMAVIIIGFAKINDTLKKKTRAKYSGLSLSIMSGAKFLAPIIGGFLADYFFIRFPFIIAACLLFITLLVFIFKKHKVHRHHSSKFTKSDLNIAQKLKLFLKIKDLRALAILGFAVHFVIPLFLLYLPLYIVEDFGLPYKYVGFAFFAMGFFRFFQYYFGKFSDKISHKKAISLGCLIFSIFLILGSFVNSYYLLLAVLLLVGFGEALWNVSCLAFLSDIGERHHHEGEVFGSYFSFAKIGSFISNIVSGYIVLVFGTKTLMLIVGCIILLATIISGIMFHKKNKNKKAELIVY